MASDLGLSQSMMPFTDQVAVVTGASSGLGKAITLGVAMNGATVCLVGRLLEALGAVAQSAPTIAPRILCQRADLTEDNDIQALAAYLQRAFRSIDVLVHSHGPGGRIPQRAQQTYEKTGDLRIPEVYRWAHVSDGFGDYVVVLGSFTMSP